MAGCARWEGQTRTAASAVNEAETEPSGRCESGQECIIYDAPWVGDAGAPKAVLYCIKDMSVAGIFLPFLSDC